MGKRASAKRNSIFDPLETCPEVATSAVKYVELIPVAVDVVSLFLRPLVENSLPVRVIASPYVLVKLFAVIVRGALLTVNAPLT